MASTPYTAGVVAGRLAPSDYAVNFADHSPPLDPHEARVAADRCYFCHDAPCITACPTTIDIPLFIRQIATGTPDAAARTIFQQNIFGGMCARVCPTENLCEGACVRMEAEGSPVEIGALQRFATDPLIEHGVHPFTRAEPTGKRIAVIGGGPAGLACAHRLALKGHEVTVFEAREKPGGLNEYGIASYKSPQDFAQREIAWLLQIGGITIRTGTTLGRDLTLDEVAARHDAVFLGIGLGGVNGLGIPGEDAPHVQNAVDFIARLRQAGDKSILPIGRDVVVIGGGMTAVDAAVQSKLLGALNVTIVYRRGQDRMSASDVEQNHALTAGVRLITNAVPVEVRADGAVVFEYTVEGDAGSLRTGETFALPADQVFKAIGQTLAPPAGVVAGGRKLGAAHLGGKIWAGGDCARGGEDLTVTAVAEGRDAAEAIHAALIC